LNLSNLTEGQQLEADQEYRICARRGSSEDAQPMRRKQRKITDDDESEGPTMTKTIREEIHQDRKRGRYRGLSE